MLSVIGLIRFAMGISENIVMGSDSYEVEELPAHLDVTRTIRRSLLSTKAVSQPPLLGSQERLRLSGKSKDDIK
jgi:hypothetical protein